MAQALKEQFGDAAIMALAQSIVRVYPAFAREDFLAQARQGFEALDLMARGRHLAAALRRHLPPDPGEALRILTRAMGPKLEKSEGNGMASFFYLPHSFFVAEYGLEHFDAAMDLQYELTQRFTAEFSIRPFLERDPQRTMTRLLHWATDPSAQVRRLVSEGTRPRLPWAPRLKTFEANPEPVLKLLEMLKDDPEVYVRRSVANHLNDLGKDHPRLLLEIAKRWLEDAPEPRRILLRHALRSLVKSGDREALQLLGFGRKPEVKVESVKISPRRVLLGERVRVAFALRNLRGKPQELLVDLRVHFVKGGGEARPKVFKLRSLTLGGAEVVNLQKTISLAQLSTRKHYTGRHEVEALINGRAVPLGDFLLSAGKP